MDEERFYRALGMFAALTKFRLGEGPPLEQEAATYTSLIGEFAKHGCLLSWGARPKAEAEDAARGTEVLSELKAMRREVRLISEGLQALSGELGSRTRVYDRLKSA